MTYDMIDRFLRNNLSDDDYEEYSSALNSIANPPKEIRERQLECVILDLKNEIKEMRESAKNHSNL